MNLIRLTYSLNIFSLFIHYLHPYFLILHSHQLLKFLVMSIFLLMMLIISYYLCKFSPGLDCIPGNFLFNLRDTLSWPHWFIFRKSIDESIFPFILKLSSLLSVLKAGSLSKVLNYRPITNLFYVSKIVEP